MLKICDGRDRAGFRQLIGIIGKLADVADGNALQILDADVGGDDLLSCLLYTSRCV